jgi:hypothetical protein
MREAADAMALFGVAAKTAERAAKKLGNAWAELETPRQIQMRKLVAEVKKMCTKIAARERRFREIVFGGEGRREHVERAQGISFQVEA